jgi:Bax protein
MSTYLKILTCSTSFLIHLLIGCFFCTTPALVEASPSVGQDITTTIRSETTSGLQSFFHAMEYDWMQLEGGVPPFILEIIPPDINGSVSTAEKKQTFFMGLLPMILLANQEIEKERAEILQILKRYSEKSLKDNDLERLTEISKRYGLRGRAFTDHRTRSRLLQRVDTIPPALVLAQAANESAWGTSRFSRLGNNLFGEWTFKPGTGIVPADRPPGETYEVRKFSSLYESIRSYMNNINRNGAYRKVRELRHELRESRQPVSGMILAKGLLKYSQRGEEYIREIQTMIRQNKLARVNTASLRQPRTEILTSISTSGGGLFSTRNRAIGHLPPLRSNP